MKKHHNMKLILLFTLSLTLILCFSLPAHAAGNGLSVQAVGKHSIKIPWGGQLSMAVEAHCDEGPLFYQWYHVDDANDTTAYTAFSGETGASFSRGNVTLGGTYRCTVSDNYGNTASEDFYVALENGLWAEADGQTHLSVPFGETITLRVKGGADRGELHYRWASEMDSDFQSIDAPSYPLQVNTRDWISCNVSDEYGNSVWVWFEIRIDNQLTVDNGGYKYFPVRVPYGEQAVLEAKASCAAGALHYNWRCDTNPSLQSVDSASITTPPVTGQSYYFCDIEDEYGNTVFAAFDVSVDNQLTVSPVGDIEISVPPGRNTFTVEASCLRGELHYSWNHQQADSASYTFEDLAEDTDLVFFVWDDFGNLARGVFKIHIKSDFDNELRAEAVQESVLAAPNTAATMEVSASCRHGQLFYAWYGPDGLLTDNTTETLRIESVTEAASYSCVVSDEYGNSVTVDFQLLLDSSPFPNAIPLELGKQATASIMNAGDMAYFRFVPEETLEVLFSSYGNADTYGILYDANGSPLLSDDDSGSDFNFSISCNLEAGTTYYLGARFFNGGATGSFDVSVIFDNKLTIEPVGSTYRTVRWGGDLDLQVEASCSVGNIVFQWYREILNEELNTYERTPIDGAVSSICHLPNVTAQQRLVCVAQDSFGSTKELFYQIGVENGLWAEAIGPTELTVPYGQQLVLRVKAGCDHGELHYRWVNEMEREDSDPPDSPEYTLTANTRNWVSCTVSDECGNSVFISYNILIDNGLTVSPDQDPTIIVNVGDSLTLDVQAGCKSGEIHFFWRDGSWNELLRETGTSSSCTLDSITKTQTVICSVRDDYGNDHTVRFYIVIDNGFKASAVGGTKLLIEPGNSLQLQVDASCREGELHYDWSGPSDLYTATSSDSILTSPLYTACDFSCLVSDDFGNTEYIDFRILIENAFTAVADGSPILCATAGEALTLRVNASCRDGELSYMWTTGDAYFNDLAEPLDAANEPALNITVNNKLTTYICIVSDQYGNSRSIPFLVAVPDIRLPSSLTTIETEAFAGISRVVIWVPSSVTEIAEDVFDPSVFLIGNSDYLMSYLLEHGSYILPYIMNPDLYSNGSYVLPYTMNPSLYSNG